MRILSRRLVAFVGVMMLALTVFAPTSANAADRLLNCKQGNNYKACSYMTANIANTKSIAFRDSVSNSRNYAITGNCQASTSKTFTWSVGGSLSTEVKAGIFGGVKAEVNGSIAKSSTTGYVTSADFKVPARDVVYCDRGVVVEQIKGYTKTSACGGGCSTTRKSWTFKAPTRARWWIY